ncbi:MAG: hypothetical protein AAFR22_25345, partial [Chloroflexota bacterium]
MEITRDGITVLIEILGSSSALAFVCASLAILTISLSVSAYNQAWIRYGFIILTAIVTWQFAFNWIPNPDALWQDYYFNLSTELIGTLITAALIGFAVFSNRWLYPLLVFVIIMAFLPMESMEAGGDGQMLVVNLSSELIGAFILRILIDDRHNVWNRAKKAHESAKRRLAKELRRIDEFFDNQVEHLTGIHQRKQEDAFEAQLATSKAKITQTFEVELENWYNKVDACDTYIVITGETRAEVNFKKSMLSKAFELVEDLKPADQPINGIYECCFAARIKRKKYRKPAHTIQPDAKTKANQGTVATRPYIETTILEEEVRATTGTPQGTVTGSVSQQVIVTRQIQFDAVPETTDDDPTAPARQSGIETRPLPSRPGTGVQNSTDEDPTAPERSTTDPTEPIRTDDVIPPPSRKRKHHTANQQKRRHALHKHMKSRSAP